MFMLCHIFICKTPEQWIMCTNYKYHQSRIPSISCLHGFCCFVAPDSDLACRFCHPLFVLPLLTLCHHPWVQKCQACLKGCICSGIVYSCVPTVCSNWPHMQITQLGLHCDQSPCRNNFALKDSVHNCISFVYWGWFIYFFLRWSTMFLRSIWQSIGLYRKVIPPSQILEDKCHRRGFYSWRWERCECGVAL